MNTNSIFWVTRPPYYAPPLLFLLLLLFGGNSFISLLIINVTFFFFCLILCFVLFGLSLLVLLVFMFSFRQPCSYILCSSISSS